MCISADPPQRVGVSVQSWPRPDFLFYRGLVREILADRGGVYPLAPVPPRSRHWEGRDRVPPLGGLAAPQTPLLTWGASPPGPPDLHYVKHETI